MSQQLRKESRPLKIMDLKKSTASHKQLIENCLFKSIEVFFVEFKILTTFDFQKCVFDDFFDDFPKLLDKLLRLMGHWQTKQDAL